MLKQIITLLLFFVFFGTVCAQETISEINFKGHKKTRVTYLQKYLGIEVNDIVDTQTIEKAVQNLKNLTQVYHASYELSKNAQGASILNIDIRESQTLLPYFNFGNGDFNNWFEVGFSEQNFLGKGYSIGAIYHWQGKNSFILNSRFPALFGKHLGFGFNTTFWKLDEPLYFDTGEPVLYEYNFKLFEPVLIYDFQQNNYIELATALFTENYSKLGENPEALPGPKTLSQTKWAIKLNYNFSRVNYHYFYLDGIANKLQLQNVRTEGEQGNYVFFVNNFLFYNRFGKKGNFATRLRFGLATNRNSPFSPFALDNHTNIRGVGDRVDRGTGVIALSLEYRHTLIEFPNIAIQVAAFMDNGTWRKPGGEFNQLFGDQTLKIYAGPGTRLIWKKAHQAVLRIDYGISLYGENSSGLVVGLGQYF